MNKHDNPMCLAIPGQIQRIDDDELRTGLVSFGGISQNVCLALVPEAKVGDFVIVHVGFAISRVNEEAAREALKLWETTQHSPHSQAEPSPS